MNRDPLRPGQCPECGLPNYTDDFAGLCAPCTDLEGEATAAAFLHRGRDTFTRGVEHWRGEKARGPR